MEEQLFQSRLAAHDLNLTDHQLQQFADYAHLLVQWNQKMNLTTVTSTADIYLKHFYDSLTATFYEDFRPIHSVVDVGAGAGFPGIPIKICFPHLQLTMVDSLKKRVTFLEHVCQQLQLEQVHLYHERAEAFGRQKEHREQYDMVIARAVARLNVLTELCLPLVKIGKKFLALKGAKGDEEKEEAYQAIQKLGGVIEGSYFFQLPDHGGRRSIFIIHKKNQTPATYPRKPGTPNKKPIF